MGVTNNEARAPSNRSTIMDLLIVGVVWCASLVLVNPIGDFPLNDDWSFALTVHRLLEDGEYRPTGWASMSLLTHALWGAIFCLPAGFSFTALRFSTIAASLVGILASYFLVRGTTQNRRFAVLAAFTVGFSPIWFALSNTFMTDVPYTAITILAAILFARYLRGGSDPNWIAGAALAVAATLSRQVGVATALAFGLVLLGTRGFTYRNFARAILPAALCFAALFIFQRWLTVNDRLPALYHARTDDLFIVLSHPALLFRHLARNLHVALLYLGWFLLPILLAAIPGLVRQDKRRLAVSLAVAGAGTIAAGVPFLIGRLPLMPISYNVLVRSGVGPLLLRDTGILKLEHVPELPNAFWGAVTIASLLGAALLLAMITTFILSIIERLRAGAGINSSERIEVFLLLSAAIYFLPLLPGVDFFDRYMVPALPFVAAVVAGIASRFPTAHPGPVASFRVAAIAALVATAVYSVGITRDYLAWNRVRWLAMHELMEKDRIDASDIDGGFEFNGLFGYDPGYQPDSRRVWWWIQRDTYLVTFGWLPGYTVYKEYTYSRWLPPQTGRLLVLRKIETRE